MRFRRIVKQINTVLLIWTIILAVAFPAYADDGHLIGNFPDEENEDTGGENGESTESNRNMIQLSNGVTYSPDTDLFYHKVGSGSFGTNVPAGAIVTEAVRVELSPALTGMLYRNGVLIEAPTLSDISEPGKYILAVTANDASQTVRVAFTIVSSVTGSIKEYELPDDFFIVSATVDGETANYSRSYVDLKTDGNYEIHYRSPAANKDFYLSVTIDHTPPTATLPGVSAGKSNTPVSVEGLEENAEIYLERNGKEIPYTGVIEETGSYVLTVQDEAGNETSYNFAVITYDNSKTKYLLVLGAVLLVGLAGYFLYYRKYIRVK